MTRTAQHRSLTTACIAAFAGGVLALSGCVTNSVETSVRAGQQARKDAATELLRDDEITVVLVGTGGPMHSNRAQAINGGLCRRRIPERRPSNTPLL